MLEAAIAATGFCVSGYLARMFAEVGAEQDSIACTVLAWRLYVITAYCVVRFVFWAWMTPMPFIGSH